MFERQFSYLSHILILSEVRENKRTYNNAYYFNFILKYEFLNDL